MWNGYAGTSIIGVSNEGTCQRLNTRILYYTFNRKSRGAGNLAFLACFLGGILDMLTTLTVCATLSLI